MAKFKGVILGRGKDGNRYRDQIDVSSPAAPAGASRMERRIAMETAAFKVTKDLLPGERVIYVGPENPPAKS